MQALNSLRYIFLMIGIASNFLHYIIQFDMFSVVQINMINIFSLVALGIFVYSKKFLNLNSSIDKHLIKFHPDSRLFIGHVLTTCAFLSYFINYDGNNNAYTIQKLLGYIFFYLVFEITIFERQQYLRLKGEH